MTSTDRYFVAGTIFMNVIPACPVEFLISRGGFHMGRKRKYGSKEEEVEAKKVRSTSRYAWRIDLGDQADRWRQTALELQIDR